MHFSALAPLLALTWTIPLVLVLGQCRNARADFFLHHWENHFQNKSLTSLQINSGYFSSDSNFDSIGNFSIPAGFRNSSRLQGEIIFEWGFAERLSTFARLTSSYFNQNSSVRPGRGFGFNDQTLGMTYRFIQNPSFLKALDLAFQVDFPAYNNSTADSNLSPYLGDGSVDFTGGGFVTLSLHEGKSYAITSVMGAGYTYRTHDFSSAIPWSIQARYAPLQSGFLASCGILGILSLRTDPNNGFSAPLRSSVGSGGSYMTGGVNPTLIQIRGQGGYRFNENTALSISATQSVWGQDAPQGLQVEMGIQIQMGELEKPQISVANRSHSKDFLEAHIIKANDRLNLVKIDKGSQNGIEAGQFFEVFLPKSDGSSDGAIARAKVLSVKFDEAALEIQEYYKEVWIEEGFLAKQAPQ